MEKYLSILEACQQQPQETLDEEKVKFINSKFSIWDPFGIPQSTYLGYTSEKSRMFKGYYNTLVKYYGIGNLILFIFACVWLISLVCVLILGLIFSWVFF